ncbi:hypothetical protein [Mesonia aestuariivivens]|uniref:Uncharacterized protein n=1 Tax=Mesonia aestuariivivens TaxID=2796128 RepID=A0ABS6W570_9FLAO|nr:hypothetical protein [Mesonia aestuariivivens]MBW2963012.1 hypothetical protein [Mesonia aestuariivivens]
MNNNKALCIKKDLIELQQWQKRLEENHRELDFMNRIHKQIIQASEITYDLQHVRRKNTLGLASLCKYELQLLKELENSCGMYDISLAKNHEKRRVEFITTDQVFFELKIKLYEKLSCYSVR